MSNNLAIKLYQSFNYECKVLIPEYYNDGEDAYRMVLPSFRKRYRDVSYATVSSRLAPPKQTTTKQTYFLNSSFFPGMTGLSLLSDVFGMKP